jgi:uncharacterized protein (TIGR03435 family)
MPEMDDIELLAQYARHNSETAFASLVERYINLVYSTALRSANNPHAAEEITQAVFIILARKAASLSKQTALSGWLYQTTRLTAANFLRTEIRRQRREQEAYMQSTLQEPADDRVWRQVAPLLDDAMGRLGEKDRNAVVLRFFENRSLREVGAVLGASEDAAKMRVTRALEKMHRFFNKRGVSSKTAIIAGVVSANSVHAAPVGLAATISASAVKGSVVATSTLTLVKGALKIMAWTKAKTAIVVGVGVLLATGTTSVVINKVKSSSVDESLWQMKLENLRKAPPFTLIIRPTRFSDNNGIMNSDGPVIAHNLDFVGLLEFAYASSDPDGFRHSFSRERMILPADIPKGHYDLMFIFPNSRIETLQQAISKKFGYTMKKEIRQTDAFVLKVKDPALLALHASKKGTKMSHQRDNNMRSAFNQPISDTAQFLEGTFHKPVLVEPGLSGRYNFTFRWQDPQLKEEALSQDLEEAGLELVPTNLPIEMLVVEKVN